MSADQTHNVKERREWGQPYNSNIKLYMYEYNIYKYTFIYSRADIIEKIIKLYIVVLEKNI